MTKPSIPKPASTIVIESNTKNKSEILLLKRNKQQGFFPKAHVFPGGVIDGSDVSWSASLTAPDRDYAAQALEMPKRPVEALAFFLGAIRETAEESGILYAVDSNLHFPDQGKIEQVILSLNAGGSLSKILKAFALKPYIQALTPISWWITPVIESKRYDTRFFWAQKPNDQVLRINLAESSSGIFITPSVALQKKQEGSLFLAPPTLAILEVLAERAANDSPVKNAFKSPNQAICPEVKKKENDQITLLLPGDPQFSDCSLPSVFRRTSFKINQNGSFN